MKTPDCHPPVHPAEIFSWHAGAASAEASDLGPASARLHDRIWTDAADVGFILRSARTGQDRLFVLAEETRREGEILAWVYRTADGIKLTVFND